jgi:hypothetical protein
MTQPCKVFQRRAKLPLAFSSLLLGIVLLGGCESSTSPPPVVSKLACEGAGGTVTECTLTLEQGGGFSVTLESVSCTAVGNRVRLTQPTAHAQTLTSDGCYETPPKVWNIGGTLTPGSTVAIEVESAKLKNDPVLRVSGDYPEWVIEFEDGGDTDFNDMVFRVRALNVT